MADDNEVEPPDFLKGEAEPVKSPEVQVRQFNPEQQEVYAAPTITGPLDEKPRRGRGRPKGSKNRPKDGSGRLVAISGQVSKREDLDRVESKVAERAKAILLSATGVIAVWRPHWQMTEQEAENIVQPGASWVRSKSGESIEKVEDWLDQVDLIAVGLGLLAYMIRVLREEQELSAKRRTERRAGRPAPERSRNRFASDTQTTNRPPNGTVESPQEREQESESGSGDYSTYTGGIGYSAPPATGQ